MKIATAFALLALVAVLSFTTDTGRAAIPPNAARSVVVSYGAHGEGRGVARIASRPTIFTSTTRPKDDECSLLTSGSASSVPATKTAGLTPGAKTRMDTAYTGHRSPRSNSERTDLHSKRLLDTIRTNCLSATHAITRRAATRATCSSLPLRVTMTTWCEKTAGAGQAPNLPSNRSKPLGIGTPPERFVSKTSPMNTESVKFSLAQSSVARRGSPWRNNVSTFYGPGFYGRPFACSGRVEGVSRYWRNVRGTAHMSLPCGTPLLVCNRVNRRCVLVSVIDRGAFHPGNLDLTARTAMDLCACSRPYTMKTKWRRV